MTQRIYTKDMSFESPMTPNVFRQEWKPAVNVDLNNKSSRVDDQGNHEVVLTLTITATLEEQTAFLVEVQQAGIFFISGLEEDAMRQLLATVAPTILFPYAREAIDNLVVKGGFPALMIARSILMPFTVRPLRSKPPRRVRAVKSLLKPLHTESR